MRRILLVLIVVYAIGTILWMSLNARWQASYEIDVDGSRHTYLIDLSRQPLWDAPPAPSLSTFQTRFQEPSLQDDGTISVHNKWDWWLLDLFLLWMLGALIVAPITFLIYRRDRALGMIARLGAGLIISAALCILLWLIVGGWGPPSPLLFAVGGLIGGSLWASSYSRANR